MPVADLFIFIEMFTSDIEHSALVHESALQNAAILMYGNLVLFRMRRLS
uniref:Uncharacterized protein n=1 Tax=Triticum urartu TaxID=4572 RepID=A0A8R7JZW2_TRIUA